MSFQEKTVEVGVDPTTAKASDKASFALETTSAPYQKPKAEAKGMTSTQAVLLVLLGCAILTLMIVPWVLYANERNANQDDDGNGNVGTAEDDELLENIDAIFPEGTDFGDVHIFVVGDWGRQDWAVQEGEPEAAQNQTDVAAAMNMIAATRTGHKVIVSTGDNFYDDGLLDLEDDSTFINNYINVYKTQPYLADLPWYVLMGNHDYRGSILAQLDFNVNKWVPNSLWRAQLGGANSILTSFNGKTTVDVAWIDTSPFVQKYRNCPGDKKYAFDQVGFPTYSLTDAASVAAFEAELQEKVDLLDSALTANDYQTTWRLAFGHHPIRSNSHHKDTVELLNQVDEVLWKHGVHAYVNGHDHDLQHVTRNYCCLFDQDNPSYGDSGSEATDPACPNSLEVPPAKYLPGVGAPGSNVPYTSAYSLMGGRPMHYFTSGAGSTPRVDDQYPELDDSALGSQFFEPGPGFLEIQAKETELNFFFYDKKGNKIYSAQIKK